MIEAPKLGFGVVVEAWIFDLIPLRRAWLASLMKPKPRLSCWFASCLSSQVGTWGFAARDPDR